jgi:hypothetical protein
MRFDSFPNGSQDSTSSDASGAGWPAGGTLDDIFGADQGWAGPDYINSLLGPEYFVNNAGEISAANGSFGSFGSRGTSFGFSQAPPPTLVGSSSGLEIDLIWDPSVANAPSGFKQAIIDAATYYTQLFSNKEVINLKVGYGEIDGSPLASNALGESESYGYLTNYSTVTNALGKDGYSFSAQNEPKSSRFFVSSAEAKSLGLVSGNTIGTGSLDGYIGFSTLAGTGYSWNFNAAVGGSNTGTGTNQFDLEAVAEHEISEVMGRLGLEGQSSDYTPLDLYNYNSAGVLERSGKGGYFSVNDGTTNLGTYNNAANGGDIADWASFSSISQSHTQGLPSGYYDAFDAWTFPGVNGALSQADILEMAALGYHLTAAGIAAT